MPSVVVAALYRFTRLPRYREFRQPLLAFCRNHDIFGTLLLAPEGINGTVAGSETAIDGLLAFLRDELGLAGIEAKRSHCDELPFLRIKVRLKREIVSIGDDEIDPTRRVGTYVSARHWNELLDDPDVVVLDTRNDYEVRIGTFEGALDPHLATFRDFPAWAKRHLDPARTRKVAMFCTGGIRCEKASSLLLREGFEEVYHLEGGILRYLETMPPEHSRWRGECFVFDRRVALDHRLRPGTHTLCFGCLEPVSVDDARSPHHEEGVCCVHCYATTPESVKAGRRERARQVELAEIRGQQHLGGA